MKPEERVVVGTETPGKWLAAPAVVEHAADADAVDMRRFNSESDDATREDIHDDHHPEALQQEGLASKQIDAPQAVAGFSDGGEPRRTIASRFWERVVRQNSAHDVLVNFEPEGVRNPLSNAGAAKGRIEAFDLENCCNHDSVPQLRQNCN